MNDKQIEPVRDPQEQLRYLRAELQTARQSLVEAEAELACYQAAVNAFRMHCRLKLDDLVDELLNLHAEKQACLTRWQLLQQEKEVPVTPDEDGPLGFDEETIPVEDDEEALVLPTDTPRDKAAEKRLYRQLARRFHPDLANTAVERAYATAMMTAVNNAYEKQDIQALYDLAGELEPETIAELAGIEVPAIRQLRQQIMSVQRRQRKVKRQMKLLRQENTARLYHRAQRLEEEGDNWWDTVRRELEVAIERRQREIDRLKNELTQYDSVSDNKTG